MIRKQFSYTGDPSSSTRDLVRFFIGDTNDSCPLFDDREVQNAIDRKPNPKIAAAELLEAKATEFARQSDLRVGDVSEAFGKVSEQMFKAADRYRCDAIKLALPRFGGLTKSGNFALDSDPDAVQPWARIDLNDHPEAIQLNQDVSSLHGRFGNVF